MNQSHVIWGPSGWAETEGWAQAHYQPATNEYNGPIDVWVSVGTSLPACAFLDPHPNQNRARPSFDTATTGCSSLTIAPDCI